ncbi:hypothetical protein JHK82_042070 [Glycine max]|nr:hypothetical protein JHK85_042743 [Glycine max]KAG5105100.1 hypothetical protein JHK82_042070 [Glycine max]KAG5116224.1 hypothetical protein JHK84_042337 [Glycine max]
MPSLFTLSPVTIRNGLYNRPRLPQTAWSGNKTAIAMGMAKSLELETPFAMITASEIFSLQILKTKAPSLSTSRKKPKSSRFKWTVPRHELLSIHMPAYSDSIVKGVSTVMVQTPVGMV